MAGGSPMDPIVKLVIKDSGFIASKMNDTRTQSIQPSLSILVYACQGTAAGDVMLIALNVERTHGAKSVCGWGASYDGPKAIPC